MGLHRLQGGDGRQQASEWIIPAFFVLIGIMFAFAGDTGRDWLRYDRVWIGQGEIWRLISGHFVHLSWPHLALNSAGLLLVWYLVGATHALRSWLAIIACSLATIDLAFWFLNPNLYWYVGLSGLLHGMLAAGITSRLPSMDVETAILLLLLIAKVGWEQFAGPVPGSVLTSGGPVVVDAHLYGALGGVLGALIARIRVKKSRAAI